MNSELYKKIKSYLESGESVAVNIFHHHKGNELFLDKDNYQTDYDFFREQFDEWWDGENGFLQVLIENEAYADSVNVRFELDGKSLLANINFTCSDINDYAEPEHYKDEIITPLLRSTLENKIKLGESIFDEENIEFYIEYDNGSFRIFQIFYRDPVTFDDQKIKLTKSETEILKKEISGIIDDWSGPFFGSNELSREVTISIEPECAFNCTDFVNYSFKIELTE